MPVQWEFVGHLLIHCHVAHSLWVFMLQAFGIQWVLLGYVVELLFCWSHWLGKHDSYIWNLILGCLMWTIWTECNRWSFEDFEKSLIGLGVGVLQIFLLLFRVFFSLS